MPQSKTANQREKIRLTVRHQRNHLTDEQQQIAAEQLTQRLAHQEEVNTAQTIALYLANDGELSTQPFIHWCWQQGKQVLLPMLHPFTKGHLIFLRYCPNTMMRNNRYGIAEPELDVTKVVPIADIDIIFTPLVAFDADGQRLGMGGGFYDRTLAPHSHRRRAQPPNKTSPLLIGLAHDCQQVERVPVEPWDIPIPQIVTPTRIINTQD